MLDRIKIIHNKNGEHILGRMCMTKGSGLLNEFEPDNIKLNYFYPITLEKLSIKLYSDDGKTLYDSQNANHSFEFEITTLKNLELVV